MTVDVEPLAGRLDAAVRAGSAIDQLTSEVSLTLDEAYAVQRAGVALRVGRGERVVGVKLGFTSKPKALQMGVADVIIGRITSAMRIADGGTVAVGAMVHPRIEPELAFRLGAAIDPRDEAADPLLAVSEVAPALEIIDSRYRNFSFSLEDVVADNTSAAGFVVGAWRPLAEVRSRIDLGNAAVVLEVDGDVVETGSTAAILGDPMRALDAVRRMAGRYGLALPAGSIVLAGAATAAVSLASGSAVEAAVAGLGRVSVTAAGGRDG